VCFKEAAFRVEKVDFFPTPTANYHIIERAQKSYFNLKIYGKKVIKYEIFDFKIA